MKRLRGEIRSVGVKSLSFIVNRRELTAEEEQLYIRNDGRALTQKWIAQPVKATFRVRNMKLYDFALSVMGRPLIVGIEEGEVVSLEPVRVVGASCPSCNRLVWPENVTKYVVVKQDKYNDYFNLQIQVSRELPPGKTTEIWATEKANLRPEIAKSNGVSSTTDLPVSFCEAREGGEGGQQRPPRLLCTYRLNVEKVCEDCAAGSGGSQQFRIMELTRYLQEQFEKEYRVYNLVNVALEDFKPEYFGRTLTAVIQQRDMA